MGRWTWVEGNINAPAKDVFEYFADDTDKLPYLLPSARVVRVLERTALPNGGQRMRVIVNVGWRNLELTGEDTEYQPSTLMRGRSSGPSGTVESEKRFSESGGRTHMEWGTRVIKRKGLLTKVFRSVTPSYNDLATRLSLLAMLARARAALQPFPQAQAVTAPTWIGVRVPPPVTAPYGWVTLAILIGTVVATVTVLSIAGLFWPPLVDNTLIWGAGVVIGFAVALQALSLLALRFVPSKLPD